MCLFVTVLQQARVDSWKASVREQLYCCARNLHPPTISDSQCHRSPDGNGYTGAM